MYYVLCNMAIDSDEYVSDVTGVFTSEEMAINKAIKLMEDWEFTRDEILITEWIDNNYKNIGTKDEIWYRLFKRV